MSKDTNQTQPHTPTEPSTIRPQTLRRWSVAELIAQAMARRDAGASGRLQG
jgi:hypothetical protein